uniref:Uncharacterized protein n=1 Tax=Arundo donax TaxID=35708 RepID=A0A0A8YPW6_ARUDO
MLLASINTHYLFI